MEMTDSQQEAVFNLLDFVLNWNKLFTVPASNYPHAPNERYSSASDSSLETSNSSMSSYSLTLVDQHNDLVMGDCDEVDNSSSSSSDGSGPDDEKYLLDKRISDVHDLSNSEFNLPSNFSEDENENNCSSSTDSSEEVNQTENSSSVPWDLLEIPRFPLLTMEEFYAMESKIETSLTFRIRLVSKKLSLRNDF